MAKNRKSQSAAIHFGPVLKVVLLCFVFGGSAVGYVWQKGQIYQLGQQIRQQEVQLAQMKDSNQKLSDQLAVLRTPTMLDRRVHELNLGLAPAQPSQIWRLPEPRYASTAGTNAVRDLAAQQSGEEAAP